MASGLGRDDGRFRQDAVACVDGLLSFALALSHDRASAEDLVQETYVRALGAQRHPEGPRAIRSWLFTILHNVWRNERRRHVAEPLERLQGHQEPRQELDAAGLLDEAAASRRLGKAVEALPSAHREIVILRYGEGFSYQQIADILRCPAGTVMSRLARARDLLREAVVTGDRRTPARAPYEPGANALRSPATNPSRRAMRKAPFLSGKAIRPRPGGPAISR